MNAPSTLTNTIDPKTAPTLRAAPLAVAARDQHPATGPQSPPPIRLLCVDDHGMLVEGLRVFFALDGRIQVVGRLGSATGLVEEVERLRADAVLMDIEMPGPDAFAMADLLCRAHPGVRVIMLSAHIRETFVSASYDAGACAYFAKSDELEDIVRGIHSVMRSLPSALLLGPKVRERCRPAGQRAPHGPARERPPGEAVHPRTGAPVTPLSTLTTRETEVLRLIGRGLSRAQIAAEVFRSCKTIDSHQSHIMQKLGIHARADLIRFAIREGLAQA